MRKTKLALLLIILAAIQVACSNNVEDTHLEVSNNGEDTHLNVAINGTAHYNAAKHHYVVNAKLKLNNTGKQKAENTRFQLQLPNNVTAKGFTYQGKMHKVNAQDRYVTIDIGAIKPKQHLSKNVKLYLTGSVGEESPLMDARTVSGNKTRQANNRIDLSAMKEA